MAKKQDATDKRTEADDGAHGRRQMLRYSLALILAGVLALGWVALLTHDAGDWPARQTLPRAGVHNYAGVVGAAFSYFVFHWIGNGGYVVLLFGSVAVALLLSGSTLRDLGFRVIGVTLLTASLSTAVYMMRPYSPGEILIGRGGVLGAGLGILLTRHFGGFAWAMVLVTALVGLVLAADKLVVQVPRMGRRLWDRREHLAKMAGALRTAAVPAAAKQPSLRIASATPRAAALGRAEAKKAKAAERVSIAQLEPLAEADSEPADAAQPAGESETPSPALGDRIKSLLTPAKIKPAPAPKPVVKKPAPAPKKPSPPPQPGEWALPGEELLIDPEAGYMASQEAQVELKRAVLQQTLTDFGVEAQVVGHMTGPVITMFELSVAPGVKVSRIASLANDIARALAAPGVRIVSPIPGKDTIGIEVPNAEKETVRLKELMQLAPEVSAKYRLPLYLGKDAGGEAIIANLASMPHMLIAGTTGSGKSVCINTIIMSLLMTRSPQEVRLILVDPKMVEMAAFENLPHLLCPIVNDMRKAESILEWAATKMDERYELLKDAGVKNVAQYNRLTPEELYARLEAETDEDKAAIQTKIPYYVIIIDELADLIMTSSKEVENHIIRIAQKARAVGIHLILATQRPSVNVVTGLIKSNMPCRISFRVASRQESRIVLDQNGAEVLLGQGDMLMLQPGTSNLSRAQGTYVDDSEIQAVVKHIGGLGEPEFNQELVAIKPAGLEDDDLAGERDPMFNKAVEIILQTQRGSVSLVQRRLGVGYSRASRIVDQMAEAGILGDYKGSQARECMMTLEDWYALQSSIEADQSGEASLDGEPTSS